MSAGKDSKLKEILMEPSVVINAPGCIPIFYPEGYVPCVSDI